MDSTGPAQTLEGEPESVETLGWNVYKIRARAKTQEFPEDLIYLAKALKRFYELDEWKFGDDDAREIVRQLQRSDDSYYNRDDEQADQLERDEQTVVRYLLDCISDAQSPLLNLLDDPDTLLKLLSLIPGKLLQARRWPRKRGNGQSAIFSGDEACIRVANTMNQLRPFWEQYFDDLRRSRYNSGFPQAAKYLDWFPELSAGFTADIDDLLKEALKKPDEGGPNYYPKKFAYRHALRELGITSGAGNLDRGLRAIEEADKKGKRLLKEQTRPEPLP